MPSLQQHHCVTYNHKALVRENCSGPQTKMFFTPKSTIKVNGIQFCNFSQFHCTFVLLICQCYCNKTLTTSTTINPVQDVVSLVQPMSMFPLYNLCTLCYVNKERVKFWTQNELERNY